MNIEELKKMVNDEGNWRKRLEAVKELEKMNCQPSKDILLRLAVTKHEKVWKVKSAAVHACQVRELTHKGKPVFLGKKPEGNLVKDIMKKLGVVRNQFDDDSPSLEEFKKKFLEMYPIPYDIYEGDKGERFDKWLSNIIPSLPKKKNGK